MAGAWDTGKLLAKQSSEMRIFSVGEQEREGGGEGGKGERGGGGKKGGEREIRKIGRESLKVSGTREEMSTKDLNKSSHVVNSSMSFYI